MWEKIPLTTRRKESWVKKHQEAAKLVDRTMSYELSEAVELVQKTATAKFDETIEVAVRLGVDPKKADQQIRGAVVLPHGTGKTQKVLVFAKGEKVKEAEAAGADYVGDAEYINKNPTRMVRLRCNRCDT